MQFTDIFRRIFSLAKQILVYTLLKWTLEKQVLNAVNWPELAQLGSSAGSCDYGNIPFAYIEEFPDQWSDYKTSR